MGVCFIVVLFASVQLQEGFGFGVGSEEGRLW